MSEPDRARTGSPWRFVPPLYFLEGIPFFLVDTVSTVFLSAIHVSREAIGHASILALPWTLKPLWSPMVDLRATKRRWLVAMQLLLVAAIGALAFALTRSPVFHWTVIACAAVAIASATHDIAADGFYLLALEPAQQAAFVGVRNTCYRLSRVFVAGGIVYLAGTLEKSGQPVERAWTIAIAVAAAVFGLGAAWCARALPRPAADHVEGAGTRAPFAQAFVSYFRQPRIVAVVAFILLYRLGESMLTRMSPSFLKEPVSQGGMELSTKELGLMWGTLGVASLLLGGILGGLLLARFGLRRCLWPMALSMHLPNILYAWAAFEHPGRAALAAVIGIEQFAYGFGFSAYMVFLMTVSRGRGYPTTHYAISTGLMGLGAIAAGEISGNIAQAIGFGWFFVVVSLCAIPGLLPLFFVPLDEARRERAE